MIHEPRDSVSRTEESAASNTSWSAAVALNTDTPTEAYLQL
jgi:hypothetical protein